MLGKRSTGWEWESAGSAINRRGAVLLLVRRSQAARSTARHTCTSVVRDEGERWLMGVVDCTAKWKPACRSVDVN